MYPGSDNVSSYLTSVVQCMWVSALHLISHSLLCKKRSLGDELFKTCIGEIVLFLIGPLEPIFLLMSHFCKEYIHLAKVNRGLHGTFKGL